VIALRFELAELDPAVEAAVDALVAADAVGRLWAKDHTVFGEDPADNANRMGWLDAPSSSLDAWPDLASTAAAVVAESDHILVMGMGGSSLFPEVLGEMFGSDAPQLHVLDSTHPDVIRRIAAACPPDRTFHVASSKSGTTLETRSHLDFFLDRSGDPRRFGVVTDPGSALEQRATESGFGHIWLADPNIGGRYSALSLFGMVPAALIGADGPELLGAALDESDALEPLDGDDAFNDAVRLAAVIGAAAQAGRDKLTFWLDDRIAAFGPWVEQLVAESLGKHGIGVVPIIGEPRDIAIAHPDDRLIIAVGELRDRAPGVPTVSMPIEEPGDLGALVQLWCTAIALAGRVLGINPFDQPDVESAKVAARQLLEPADDSPSDSTDPDETAIEQALAEVRPGDHLALCAFADPASVAEPLAAVRASLGRRLGVATSASIGPRFLHSTGQLHKGGPHDQIIFQVVDTPTADLAIPGQSFTFGTLIRAQAAGDLAALRSAGQRAHRIDLAALLALAD